MTIKKMEDTGNILREVMRMAKIFRFSKGEYVTQDDFLDIESAIRDQTKPMDNAEDEITTQQAKKNFEVIIKNWRRQ